MEKRYWFKAKQYGWGWYPSSWQGALILIIYVLLLGFSFSYLSRKTSGAGDALFAAAPWFMVATLLLLVICLLTGERPRWSWGKKR